ncbi:MAG: DMT family transporter [Bacteroidetes bacterium]|nr:MAG: DMT family transporter [Bacteroidota bacterium]
MGQGSRNEAFSGTGGPRLAFPHIFNLSVLNATLKAHLALWGVALIYAVNYFIVKDLFIQIPPLGVIALRSILSTLVFVLIWLFYIREPVRDRRDYLRLFVCALFGASLNQIFFFWGLSFTTPVHASVLMTTSPVFVFVVAWLSGAEQITWLRAGGLLLAFGAALYLALGGSEVHLGGDTQTGDLMILLNAAFYGVYLVAVRPLLLKYNTFTIVMWISLFGAVFNIGAGTYDLVTQDWSLVSNSGWISLVYIVVFVTVMTYLLSSVALKTLPSSVVGIYIYLQPVLVLASTVIAMHERVEGWKLVCTLLVMLGVFVVSYRKKNTSG